MYVYVCMCMCMCIYVYMSVCIVVIVIPPLHQTKLMKPRKHNKVEKEHRSSGKKDPTPFS